MKLSNRIAPCGIDCGGCVMHQAKDSPGLKISLSDKLGIPVEEVACDCCRDEEGVIGCQGMTSPCSVYECSKEKNVQFCCDCDEFPCDHYQPYADRATEVPHNLKVYNLCLIKKHGIEKFAKSYAKKTRENYFKGKCKI
jgi:hypothetical protein